MDFTATEVCLSVVSFVTSVLFAGVLLLRGRTMPWLTALAVSGAFASVAFWLTGRIFGSTGYLWSYFIVSAVSLICQIGVVYEVAEAAFYVDGKWRQGTRTRLLAFGLAALLAGLPAIKETPAVNSDRYALVVRFTLFASVWVYLLIFGTVVSALKGGIRWKSRNLREGYGFLAWAFASVAIDTLHVTNRLTNAYSALEYVRFGAFEIVTLYWTWSLLREGARTAAEADLCLSR